MMFRGLLVFGFILFFGTSVHAEDQESAKTCAVKLIVLGIGQDAGKPQIASHADPAWMDRTKARMATSLAVVDSTGQRYLFDAAPEIKNHLYELDHLEGGQGFRLDGIFLMHGHIGHYLGLAFLGREAMAAKEVPVYVMPKMDHFLRHNGPWDLLVKLKNILLTPLGNGVTLQLSETLSVTPFLVPHRAEYTETVGYKISGPGKSAVFIPDIDSWEKWSKSGTELEDVIAQNDVLYLDATFFSGQELPGRDMKKVPHPTISHSLSRLSRLPAKERAKVRFIHLNHTNPALNDQSEAFHLVEKSGFAVARKHEKICLD